MYQNALLNKTHVKRRAYFAFHYQEDINRVNIVRNSWVTHNAGTILVPSFTDSSLWEEAQAKGEENLKRLMRQGVESTSSVCVLIGAATWGRRWVKYEIARSVIDGKGLLAVFIDGLRCMKTKQQSVRGTNPLHFMALKKESGYYYLYEYSTTMGYWLPYSDHTASVSKPKYIPILQEGEMAQLSRYSSEYDFCTNDGYRNLGTWVNQAAFDAGR